MGISNNWAKFCGHVPFPHTTFLLVLLGLGSGWGGVRGWDKKGRRGRRGGDRKGTGRLRKGTWSCKIRRLGLLGSPGPRDRPCYEGEAVTSPMVGAKAKAALAVAQTGSLLDWKGVCTTRPSPPKSISSRDTAQG